MKRWLPTLLCLLLSPMAARAWNADGHVATGDIAWYLLNDDALMYKAEALLARLSTPEKRYHFSDATTWMDDTRQRGVDDHWHYIDLDFGGTTPEFETAWAAWQGKEQAVWALDQARATVRGTGTREERTRALARIMHLIGDLHQPLHCADRHGDSGGNGVQVGNYVVTIENVARTQNLHTFWDWAHGLQWRAGAIVYDRRDLPHDEDEAAEALVEGYPASAAQAGNLESRAWAKESYLAACTAVYGRAPVNQATTSVALPAEYVDNARVVARTRLVLAGQRLAAELRALRPVLMAME